MDNKNEHLELIRLSTVNFHESRTSESILHLIPYQLTILTTRNCVAECRHCLMWSAPGLQGRLTYEQMVEAIDNLHKNFALRVVVFAGGEPLLLGNDLLDAIAHADSLGIITRLVTSAYPMTNIKKAKNKLMELREAGLAELNISADDYHLPYVDFERVVNTWKASKGLGFKAVIIANSHGPKSVVTPEYIMEKLGETIPLVYDDFSNLQPLPSPSEDGTIYAISNTPVQALGRALHKLDRSEMLYPEHQESLSIPCPWAVRSPALSANGHMLACCGIDAENNMVLDFGVIDNKSGLSATERVSQANKKLIVNAITSEGPAWLMKFLQKYAPEILFRDRYTSVCEICEHITTRQECVEALNKFSGELAFSLMVSGLKKSMQLAESFDSSNVKLEKQGSS